MKKFLLWMVFLTICPFVWAQSFQISQNSYQKVSVSFTPGTLSVENISVPEGDFTMISLPDYGSSYVPGAPQLPQLCKLLQTPVCDSVVATVVNAQYRDFDAAELGISTPVFPTQISAAKNGDVPPFAYDQTVYSTDAFYSLPLVRVEKAGVKRDVALANIYVSPVQYNPVTRKFRIYSRVDVEFTFVNADMAATAALQKYASPMFSQNRDLVINKMQPERSEFQGTPIKYLIIGNPMFESNENLAEFVAWKRRLGYLVEVVFTSDANVGSTTTSIKSFIQNKYDNATAEDPAPTFILLLGDREQLPAFTGQSDNSHITDLYYATLNGNDFLPDCYYGRLSATNNQQLSNQIEKILMYEQYSMPDPSYLGNAVLIAGTDSYWSPNYANGQVNYINSNYINIDNPRYTNVMKHLYNCSSQAAQIRSEVSAGSGWTNYTAHGSETSWADPEFTVSQVYQLQNTDKYGLMIGNCCQSGNFKISECFGEALLRAEKKGAMGYIGATNNTLWYEDFYWAVGYRSNVTANPTYMANSLGMYDKLFHTHNEDHSVWASTIGGIITGGNMAVQSSSSDDKQYYWEIYHCFGDPSVRAYLGVPSTMVVEASSVITNNSTNYVVHAAPYAYVALTNNSNPVFSAFADASGEVTFNIPSSLDPGEYELVVLGQNYIPYFQNVMVIAPNGPYVIPATVEVADNTVFNEGATVRMNLSLSNVGVSDATQVYATLTPESAVTMLQDSVFVGNMAFNATENRNNAFSFVMPASEDFAILPFTLSIHWHDTIITRGVNVRVKLPKVTMDEYTTSVNHVQVQNYTSGDTVVFSFKNKNKGHVAVGSGSVDLTCNYSGVNVMTDLSSISGLAPNEVSAVSFHVQIADSVPAKSLIPLYYHIFYDNIHFIDTLLIMVGDDFDGFESNSFTQYNWTMNNNPWVIISNGAYSGNYCARSAQNLSNNAKSQMSISVSIPSEAPLTYYRKVSSEANYDKFFLYLDDSPVDEADGNVSWTIFTTMIPAGTHTLKFSYEKDGSQSSGSDCVWIDNVSLPCIGVMVIEDFTDTTEVGLEDYELARATVYPNPTSEWVNIESETPAQKIVLYDFNGRVVKAVNLVATNRYQLNMNDVPAGFYLLQITFDNQRTQNLKIIKR
ncbi:MAG: T9SS type A sorting domain-containing protein [Bacteroidales bacterium]|nr:T9SS type A sorting domain-containing protein [Bacteroidales bacterium]